MNYKEVIESRYNRQNWLLLLHDIFGSKAKFWNTPSAVQTSSPFARQALWLGTITLSDEQNISIYEVELADNVDIERNRRGIRDMLLTDWRNKGNAGAFMFCYRQNESVLRFSYVSESWKFADDGTLQKESTDTKRFTYLLGEGHRSRTAIQQFEKLRDSKLSLQDLTKAFSVEAVSDMFFRGYKQQYEDIIFFVTGKRMVKVSNKWEERQEGTPNAFIMEQFAHFENPEKAVRDYVKKLMGRLVFLQYLQKKGWLGVPVSKEWGDGDLEFIQHLFEKCTDKDHFVDNVLEVLFDDLNTKREGDLATPSIGGGRGRLIPYLNGGLFEREATDETEFPLPAKYMQNLLDFFASYNFTIDENDPDDAEVGVDPEMLGRIFENLLEDNKDKGAFYTPKEIVQYMCRESLIAYLQTDVEDEATKEAIRQFVTTHDAEVLGNIADDIDQRLKDVKICDPAIGSGAFPMGLLKELFLCRTALEGFSQEKAAEIKKHIIQQNIYGVDIERGAVDIARLRFWLSLIVDEETPQALPNLDFKIMQGNSLLEQYKGVDLSKLLPEKVVDKEVGVQASFFDAEFGLEQLELKDLLNEYYDCTDHDKKKELRKQISDTIQKQIHDRGIKVDFGDIDLSGNSEFMLWHTWFHDVFEKGGFDIVIGNPPYVDIKGMPKNDVKMYFKNFQTCENRINLYAIFIEKGMTILAQHGILCYINPNSMLMNESYQKLRNLLINDIDTIIKLPDSVFNSATVETIIIRVRKDNNSHIVLGGYFKNNAIVDFSNIRLVKFEREIWNMDEGKRFNIFISKEIGRLIVKIQNQAKPLSSYVETSLGITPYDKAKGHSQELIKQRKYHSTEKINDTYVPLIAGKNITPYVISGETEEYLSYGEWLGAPREQRFFTNPRIIVRQIVGGDDLRIIAAYADSEPTYFTQIGFSLLSKKNDKEELKYILALLNSRLLSFYHKNKFLDIEKVTFQKILIANAKLLPIYNANNSQLKPIIGLVDKIISAKKGNSHADTSLWESEIDRLVYKLYGLTYDEVLIIDPNPPFTREDYIQ